MLKKVFALLIIAVLCFSCFGVSAADDKESAQSNTAKNLVEERTSTFENVNSVAESGWMGFSAGTLSIDATGYRGSCLKMTTPAQTWGSPTIDIFPFIKEEGTYSISMFVKFDGDTEQTLSLIVRGTRENSFIETRGTNFYGNIGSTKVQPGQWTQMTAEFTVKAEDISEKDNWNLCFSSIKPEIKAIYIDEVVLVKGKTTELPENAEPDEDVVVAEKSKPKNEKELYDPQIKKTAIKTSVVTAIIVVLTIALKIIIPKMLKKGEEK